MDPGREFAQMRGITTSISKLLKKCNHFDYNKGVIIMIRRGRKNAFYVEHRRQPDEDWVIYLVNNKWTKITFIDESLLSGKVLFSKECRNLDHTIKWARKLKAVGGNPSILVWRKYKGKRRFSRWVLSPSNGLRGL